MEVITKMNVLPFLPLMLLPLTILTPSLKNQRRHALGASGKITLALLLGFFTRHMHT